MRKFECDNLNSNLYSLCYSIVCDKHEYKYDDHELNYPGRTIDCNACTDPYNDDELEYDDRELEYEYEPGISLSALHFRFNFNLFKIYTQESLQGLKQYLEIMYCYEMLHLFSRSDAKR